MLAVLPYQLGFHPRDSLVVVSLHGARMGLVQRIDLPPAEHATPPWRLCSPGAARGRRRTACCCWAIEPTEGRRAAPGQLAMTTACDEAGVAVRDRIRRPRRTVVLPACADQPAVPPGGRPLPAAARGAGRGRVRRPRDQPDGRTGRRWPTGCARRPHRPAQVVAACADDWLAARRAASRGHRRRPSRTCADASCRPGPPVLRCRDDDGPMPELTPASWPGWPSRSPTSTSATRSWPGSARAR